MYWSLLKTEKIQVEKKMENLNPNSIMNLSSVEFYKFLYEDYFRWKYTVKKRLVTTRKQLMRYEIENRFSELDEIKNQLFSFDLKDIKKGLEIASSIHGLGIADASGLLALLFPRSFGTVDQFVVKDLNSIEGLYDKCFLRSINPENIKLIDGVRLISIMREKADTLNRFNNTDIWTPRLGSEYSLV